MHGVSSPDDKKSQKDEQQQGNKLTPRTTPEPKLSQEATPESEYGYLLQEWYS